MQHDLQSRMVEGNARKRPLRVPCKTLQSVEARVPEDRQFLGSLAGGVSAGLAASIVRVPTEVLKQRMQTGEAGFRPSLVPSCALIARALRRPCLCPISAAKAVSAALLFDCQGGQVFQGSVGICVQVLIACAGCSAGEFRGAINAIRGIVAKEGTRGLFAGYGSFLLRDLPFDAIEFVAYEQLKKAWKVCLIWLLYKQPAAPLPLALHAHKMPCGRALYSCRNLAMGSSGLERHF